MDKIEKVNLLGFGIIKKSDCGNTEEKNSESPTGYFIRTSDVEIVEQTMEIRSDVGTTFGIKYEITGVSGGVANFMCNIHHPKLTNPETRVVFSESNESKSNYLNAVNFDFYEFEESWEIREGIWKFTIQQGEQVLLEQDFRVVKNV